MQTRLAIRTLAEQYERYGVPELWSALSRCFSIRLSFGFGAITEPPASTLSWRGRFALGSPLEAGTEARGELTACFSI